MDKLPSDNLYEVLAEMKKEAEANPRPRYLVEGWHELAIDMVQHLYREHSGLLFAVEGHVLRSTAPDFAGERFAYVFALKWAMALDQLPGFAKATGDVTVTLTAREADVRARWGVGLYSDTLRDVVGCVVLADTFTKKSKATGREIFVTRFEASK